MKKQKTVVSKIYDITPIDVKYIGPQYNPIWRGTKKPLIDGWQIGVKFSGNIESLVFDEVLSKEYGLLPNHATMIYREYIPKNDITYVRYLFNNDLFVNGEKRAHQFKERIQMQMVNNADGYEVLSKETVVPFSVSEKPEDYVHGKNIGYKVSVKFDGEWGMVHPSVFRRFKYSPRGAKVINFNYDFLNNITDVDFLFENRMFSNGLQRAQNFVDNMNTQIEANKEKSYYMPTMVGAYEVYYCNDIFKKIVLPVHFGDVHPSVKIADACVPQDMHRDFGVKQLPLPISDKVVLEKGASNNDYIVRYVFNNRSFQDAFFDMNRFRAAMLSMVGKQKIKA